MPRRDPCQQISQSLFLSEHSCATVRAMKGWLKAAWHDPVGSKVIAGIILFALGGLATLIGVLWSESDFSTNASDAWNAAKHALVAFVTWTATSLPVSRGWLAMLICLGVLGWACAAVMWLHYVNGRLDWFGYGTDALRKEFPPKATTPTRKESLPTDELPQVSTSLAMKPLPAEAEKPSLPSPGELSMSARKLLFLLYEGYGKVLYVQTISPDVGLSFPACEQLCEKLASLNLITLKPRDDFQSARASLTKIGRDYCLEHGIEDTLRV
jgi:hypothetical protein